MPQTTYLPFYTASYPILAKVQKPGGVTVLSAVTAGDVPNKPTFTAGTIQSFSVEGLEAEPAAVSDEDEEEQHHEEVEEEVEEDDGNGGTVKRKRTVTRSRTTTRHRR